MQLKTTISLITCAFALLPAAGAAAGDFDCSVVYDEFESLMNRQFLETPDRYVQTVPGRVSREQFESVTGAGFRLYPSREGMGIGIMVTNRNVHAKFLFHWSDEVSDGPGHVIIEELVKYGRVEDGYAPQRIGPFRLKPGMAIDIDGGDYVPMEGALLKEDQRVERESGDLLYEAGPDGSAIKSVNGAEVQFPLDTLCRRGSA